MATTATVTVDPRANPYRIFNHVDLPLGEDGTPIEYYKALRDRALDEPVGWSEQLGGFWVAAGYDVIREIQRRPEEFSSRRVIWPDYNTGSDQPLMIAAQDDPEHRMYKALVRADFSMGTVQAYDAPVRRMINDLIDGFIGDGVCEVSDVVADEVPARLTAHFLGLEEQDSATYRKWVEVMAHGTPDAADTQRVLGEMFTYFDAKVRTLRRSPGDNVLSRLIQVDLDGRPLTDEELIAFCALLLLGGIHNSAKLMANAFWRLGWDHGLRRRLVAEPALIPTAVNEFLRFYTPASVGREVAVDRATVAGVPMTRGQIVLLALPVANRDPRAFTHPDEFIVDRDPNAHVALGYGIHSCLGAHLLRVEVKAVLEEFLRRIPEFTLDLGTRKPHWQLGQTSGLCNVMLRFPAG